MAGDWLKVETVTPDKPEVLTMAHELNIDPDAVFGKLFRVWTWFDSHSEDGNAPSVTQMLLDRQVGVSGFVTAMINVGWMIKTEEGLTIPNFGTHNGESAKKRANTARRVAKHKKNNKEGNASESKKVTPEALPKALPREEKRREENNNKASTPVDSTSVEPTKAVSVCVAISKIYKTHGHSPVDIAKHNPTLIALIEAGASVGEFEDAAEAAMQQTPKKGFGWILGRVRGQREQAAQSTIVKGDFGKKVMPWYLSAPGIEAKGKELGIEYRKDEQFPSYKMRVRKAAGLTDEEYAKGKADFEGKRA